MNSVDTHFLIAAISVITLALVFYTAGVWGEKIQNKLKVWHLVCFFLGLLADTVGTGLMEHISVLTGKHNPLHTITGFTAITLMFIHAIWAIVIYLKGSEKAKAHFHRFSIFVWIVWLIPYCIGAYIGSTSHI